MSDQNGSEPALSEGKQTLLRALEHVSEVEETDDGELRFLGVAWAVKHKPDDEPTYTTIGWSATDEPSFVIAALFREVANGVENDWRASVQESEDEDDDE